MSQTAVHELLEDIEQRQVDVLHQLDDLNARVESVLKEHVRRPTDAPPENGEAETSASAVDAPA